MSLSQDQYNLAYSTLSRLLGYKGRQAGLSHEDIEDLVQEVVIKVFQKQNQFDHNRPFEPWLKIVGLNLLRDLLDKKSTKKAKSRPKVVSLNYTDGEGNGLPEPQAPQPTVFETAFGSEEEEKELRGRRAQQQQHMEAVLAGLKPRDRKVVRLHLSGFKNKDIAVRMKMNANTVGVVLHRFRRCLKDRTNSDKD